MIKTPLRPHQAKALSYWRRSSGTGFGLFMEQRTGKTLTALAIVDELSPSRLLIVCPRKAVSEWERQLPIHWESDCEVRIHTYGELPARRAHLQRWIRGGVVIADESHRAKSRSSLGGRSLRSVGRKARYRLALTGTPIGQNIHDTWAQFNFLDPSIFGKWSDFRDQYCVMGGYKDKQVVDTKNIDEFNDIFHQHSYRVKLREIQPNQLRARNVMSRGQLGPRERKAYDQLEEELIVYVNQQKIETPLVVTKVMKLQQITGGFILDEWGEPQRIGRSKVRLLERLISELPRPLVIVFRFKQEQESILRLLDRRGEEYQTISGEGNFYTPDDPPDVVVIQIQSGVAIDLSLSPNIVFFSWDYSFINHDQMKSRILFYNAKKVCYYYLVMENTVDEVLLSAVRRKKKLADLVCDRWRKQ